MIETTSTLIRDVPIAGIQPMTTIDFPGRTAAVLFTQGCLWNCRYCHNPSCRDLNRAVDISWDFLEDFLRKRTGFLDGIVLSGGEPTINPHLHVFLTKIRRFGYQIALHTNGCNPEMLKCLIKQGLVDFVAMDVKAPPALYDGITRQTNTGVLAARSISVILESGVENEFRTTYHPSLLSEKDLLDTVHAAHNSGVKTYYIQRFRKQGVSDSGLVRFGDIVTVPPTVVTEASRLFDVFDIR